MMAERVRVVDLFCGCGGLGLGFELFQGSLRYDIVLGMDLDLAPVRCFNANHPRPSSILGTGRVADLVWFSNETEILLYYLIHYAHWAPDHDLWSNLSDPAINVPAFLTTLRKIDHDYEEVRKSLTSTREYTSAVDQVDRRVFPIQICKAFFQRLGIAPPRNHNALKLVGLPWVEEYSVVDCGQTPLSLQAKDGLSTAIGADLENTWDSEVDKLREASKKSGRGQNKPVAGRLQTLLSFLDSDTGKMIRDLWLQWRTKRDTLRAEFCKRLHDKLSPLYDHSRRVHLILGGPPCKGFSRVGRPVISDLHKQGTYSWASEQYADQRNALLYHYVLFLSALRPDAFVFENVENFKSPLDTPSQDRIDPPAMLEAAIESLSNKSVHFTVRSKVLQASQYAVPQRRLRFFMVGFDSEHVPDEAADRFFHMNTYKEEVPLLAALLGIEPPAEFAFASKNGITTAYEVSTYVFSDNVMPLPQREFLNWISQPGFGESNRGQRTDAHIVRKPRLDDYGLIKSFAPGLRWMDYVTEQSDTINRIRLVLRKIIEHIKLCDKPDLPSKAFLNELLSRVNSRLLLRLLIENIDLPSLFGENHLLSGGYLSRGVGKHGDWFQRLDACRPCKTIVAHIGKDTYGYIHPFEPRAISMREAARIQTFPDFFRFGTEGVVEGYSMIGNAVPPLLANAIAQRFSEIHDDVPVFVFGRKQRVGRLTSRNRRRPIQGTMSLKT